MKDFGNYRDLVLVLTQKELKVRYKNYVLGYIWSVANPLALSAVYYVAFKIVMRVNIPDYTLFLIAGLFPWQWFANSVGASCGVFLGNASIIKKVNFPRNILPLAIVLQDMIHFVLSIPVIVLFIFIYDRTPHVCWIWGIPLLLVIQLFMTYGVALVVSSVNMFFRDMERLTGILLMFLFFLTPILYSADMVPKEYAFWSKFLNPFTPLVISWRLMFLEGYLVPRYLAASSVSALVAFLFGYYIYRKLSKRFAEVI
jgi:lipopolysaccharide transport system permease protein